MRLILLRFLFALGALIAGSGAAMAGCTATPRTLTFATSSSYDVRAGTIQPVTGPAGLACSGSLLSLLGGSTAKATATSANGFLLSAGGADSIAYQLSADPNGAYVFTQGGTVDYMNSTLLSLLGITNATNFQPPIYAKLTGAPNVAAGTYTDLVTVQWNYSICNGIQITFVCLGYETGTLTNTILVSITVTKDCRINAPDVSFGSAPLVAQFSPVTQSVLVDCTKNSAYKISFTAGNSGTARPWRRMSDGAGNSLQYNLYRSDGVTIWDESNPQDSPTPGTGGVTPSQAHSYVAKINPDQVTPPAGAYQDQLSILISF